MRARTIKETNLEDGEEMRLFWKGSGRSLYNRAGTTTTTNLSGRCTKLLPTGTCKFQRTCSIFTINTVLLIPIRIHDILSTLYLFYSDSMLSREREYRIGYKVKKRIYNNISRTGQSSLAYLQGLSSSSVKIFTNLRKFSYFAFPDETRLIEFWYKITKTIVAVLQVCRVE